jgi:membrane-bound metal-dependent hydrolase YbcI (DUF457 family)
MFIGHFAVGLGAKQWAPQTSLGALIAAPIFLDVLWPFFVLTGIEQVRIDPGNTKLTPLDFVSYPWSHSLLMSFVWATLFAGFYWFATHYRAGSIAIWIGVVSHWILDVIVHRADMPLYPGSQKFGLGLWNLPAVEITLEILMVIAGAFLYARTTKARDRIGKCGFWIYVLALFGFYTADLLSRVPTETAIRPMLIGAIVFSALLILWAWWFDKHRTTN